MNYAFKNICHDFFDKLSWQDIQDKINSVSVEQVEAVLAKPEADFNDLQILLSPAAGQLIEPLAQRSQQITLQRFGRTVLMYAPIYVSNHCTNSCIYCGFNCKNDVTRCALSLDEAFEECMIIHKMGFRHILLVSGEHPDYANIEYISKLSQRLSPYFSSISIEIQPLSQEDYATLIENGVDGVTCYQETYNPETYKIVHPAGPKSVYDYRLNTLDRAAQAGIRKVGISALYGLDNWRAEAFMTGMHAQHLMTTHWQTQVSISFPRIQGAAGDFVPENPLDDLGLVQMICAYRMVFPDVNLVLSTRESEKFRNQVLPIGITQMSAASKTAPHGYSSDEATGQFEVSDQRSAQEVAESIIKLNYEPVWKDWDESFLNQ